MTAATPDRTADRLLLGGAAVTALLLLAPPALLPDLGAAGESGFDKLGHVFVFSVLAFLAVGPARARWRHPLVVAALGSTAYGGLLEILQTATGGRVAEAGDLLANGLGSAAGVLLSVVWRRP